MNKENPISGLDAFFWLLVAALFLSALVACHYVQSMQLSSVVYFVAWFIVGMGSALIAYQTSQGKRIWALAQSARVELRKVVWPTRQETIRITMLVMAVVGITALFLWAVDSFLLWLFSFLISYNNG